MRKTILISRPKDQAQEITNHLENHGFEVFIEPIFSVQKIDLKNSDLLEKISEQKIQAIILTSGNAAETAFEMAQILKFDKKIKIFSVGKKTAKLFLENGFQNIICSQQNSAADLQNLILTDLELMRKKPAENLLYFCGEFVTIDFKYELEKCGLNVEKIISYKIIEEKIFSEEFLQRIKNSPFDFVLVYSKNSAKHFCELVKKYNLLEYFRGSQILCLSEKIISYLRVCGFKNLASFDAIPILKKFYD